MYLKISNAIRHIAALALIILLGLILAESLYWGMLYALIIGVIIL